MKFWPLISLVLFACAPVRDPEFERQVLSAKHTAQPPPTQTARKPPPPPPKVPTLETRQLDEAQRAEILASIPGEGAELVATIQTAHGTVTCQLDPRAPMTVANFIGLAQGLLPWKPDPQQPEQKSRFYDGLTFHRIVKNFIVQTGNPTGKSNAGPGWRLESETGASDLFGKAGAMAMIDQGGASHGSQFFITLRPDQRLAKTYSAFGRCDAISVLREISQAEPDPKSDGKTPKEPVVIQSITVTRR